MAANIMTSAQAGRQHRHHPKAHRFNSVMRNKWLYLMFLPGFLYLIVFRYIPMLGVLIAFENYKPLKGFFHSNFVGFKNFIEFFQSFDFPIVMKNTLLINFYDLLFGFPMPIIFAILLNEITKQSAKRFIQTVSYLPYFISMVVAIGLVSDFLSPSGGLINRMLQTLFGIDPYFYMGDPKWFKPIYVFINVWKNMGFNAIIYLAAITGIDLSLYEAATIDGAGRIKRMIHITLPGIAPTIIVLLLMRLGQILDVGFETVLIMYKPTIHDAAEVISTHVYRRGILNGDFGYATAVGLFQSAISFILVMFSNMMAKKFSESSLW